MKEGWRDVNMFGEGVGDWLSRWMEGWKEG